MATKRKARGKKTKRGPGDGYAYEFRGSFKSKAAAQKRARERGGWFVSRKVRGAAGLRYIVMVPGVPF